MPDRRGDRRRRLDGQQRRVGRPPGRLLRRQRQPDRQPDRPGLAPGRHGHPERDRERRGLARRQRALPALARRRRYLDGHRHRRYDVALLGLLRHDGSRRRPLRPSRRRHRHRRQRPQRDPGREPARRQHAPDLDDDVPRLGRLPTTRPAGTRAAGRSASAAPTPTAPAPASRRCRSPSARAPATTGAPARSRAPPRSGTRRRSPAATGRTRSPLRASPPTAATRSACVGPTRSRTSRRRSSRTFTIDRAAPQTTINSNPTNPTGSNAASFGFTSDEVGSTFECRIDAGAWGACTSPKSYASLADGSHTFDVRATDVAGNTDGTPACTPGSSTRPPRARQRPSRSRAASTTRRLGRRLRHRRPLRHLLRRHRLRRHPGAGLDPPGCGQLLERHQLCQRLRGLEQHDGRRRQLVVRVRRGQLPRRRQLHRAGARGRRRRQHRVPVDPHLHVRHDEPERSLHLPGLRRQLHQHHLERGLRHERLLRHPLRQPLRRPGRPGVDPARFERPLLERHLVRLGVRGVPGRKPRGRQLVARLPGGELPCRGSVHGPRARERRRAEHRDRPVADVPDRQHGAGVDRHLSRLGRHLQHGRLERGLRDERPLRLALRRRRRRPGRPGLASGRARATTGTAPASRAAPRSGTPPPSPAAAGR